MLSGCIHENQNTHLLNGLAVRKTRLMDDNNAEQICGAIFLLIPEVQRLKELFLCWSLLTSEERAELDSHIHNCASPQRIQLYRPLKEALRRWEIVQDTQGAPGCEPGMVSFSCDPQLEEEIVNVMYITETILEKIRTGSKLFKKTPGKSINNNYSKVPTRISRKDSLRGNKIIGSKDIKEKERLLRSVHSCCFPVNTQNSMEDNSGYKTD